MPVTQTTANKELIEASEICLQKLRQGILVWTRGAAGIQVLTGAPDALGRIRSMALGCELSTVAELAGTLRDDLEILINSRNPHPENDSLPILDEIAALEAEVASLRFASDEFDLDISSLLDDSFENLKVESVPEQELSPEPEPASDPEPESTEEEGFEIDDEMMEIFAMEAEDHLKNINEHLEMVKAVPSNHEALLEIRRSAHTLKGSAGIVGLKKLSSLAHKVEDLLDHLSENGIEGNAEIFSLLQAATDCISAVANNDTSRDLEDKITRTFTEFERLLASFAEPAEAAAATEPEKAPEQPVAEVPAVEEKGFAVSESDEVKTAAFNQATRHTNRSVVRISLDTLDDLVKLVRELVFGRAVFQQKLTELDSQIKEMQNTTRRLQRSTGKLETDFGGGPLSTSNFRWNPSYPPSSSMPVTSGQHGSDEFDSLEFDRYTEFNQLTRDLMETTSDAFSITNELTTIRSYFESLYDSQKRIIDDVQYKLLSLRMIRFGTLAPRLERTVRMTAAELEKLVDLEIEGENLEVDTHILDALVEPLLHMLRNAVAHGIETPETRRLLGKDEKGRISLKVYSEGTHIILVVSDDGAGISAESLKTKAVSAGLVTAADAAEMSEEEALSLVFLPGVTTANRISQISGRGVGMNIVKTNILRQQGTVSITSEFQKGTTFTIRVPMALAIARALLVKANDRVFAFPLKIVKQISEVKANQLRSAIGSGAITLGSGKHSVVYLNNLLDLEPNSSALESDSELLLLDTVKRKCALVVDEIVKPEEIVIKPLGHPLKERPELLGATILGNGTVVPVLDLVHLIDSRKEKSVKISSAPVQAAKTTVMIVDDSPSVRHVNSRLVRANNWEPVVAKDGSEALETLLTMSELPDVVLTDVEMPEMDGYELLAMIKQNDLLKHLPVVMITSRSSEKHKAKAVELGVSEYLNKPYEDAQLISIIKRLSGKE
jgi:chemosensory pili system protein ChpA (sensor histidine kinase/response regulator)